MQPRVYYPRYSVSSKRLKCNEHFCTAKHGGGIKGMINSCRHSLRCPYKMEYADGSSSEGYFVRDILQFNQVSGDLATILTNSSISFGCGVHQSQNFELNTANYDGILGFGQSRTSIISQLAASGSSKKMFAHCINWINGGIFAIGHVVQPQVQSTPLVPNKRQLYYVNMEEIVVTGTQQTKNVLSIRDGRETMVDTGTFLAYLPEEIYRPLLDLIFFNHRNLEMNTLDQLLCFHYNGSVDDEFPKVTLIFEGSLQLVVYPRDYLYLHPAGQYCVGWGSSGTIRKGSQSITILGDMVLSNKLVIYDLENQAIGWTEYDCSSNIGLQDEQSNEIYQVGAHHLNVEIARGPTSKRTHSSDYSLNVGIIIGLIIILLSLCAASIFLCIRVVTIIRNRLIP